MSTSGVEFLGPVAVGRVVPVFRETQAAAVTLQKTVLLEADSCLISLWVTSITGGSITVTASTITEVGREYPIITFPTVTGPTTNLLLKKASLAMGRVIVKVVTTGACTFDIDLRGISAGEASTKLVGSAGATAVKYTATSTPSILIPSSLTDRSSIQVSNNSAAGTLYIGFTLAEATLSGGYPIAPGGFWVGDLTSGQVIYAVTDGPSIDVRTVQAFG